MRQNKRHLHMLDVGCWIAGRVSLDLHFENRLGDCQRQAGFTHPTWANDRDQARGGIGQGLGQLDNFGGATKEWGELGR